jgi:Cu-Zn family superoxide dismutase
MRSNLTVFGMFSALCCLAVIGATGCGGRDTARTESSDSAAAIDTMHHTSGEGDPMIAEAQLSPTQGSNVHGSVIFTQVGGGLRIAGHVTGLAPGEHGFHIHEKGDCSAPDASSAGAHWNPMSMQHGGPHTAQRHAGDLGNLTADAQGVAHFAMTDSVLTLDGENGIIGKSVVVHEKQDDLTTQPSGGSGARLACGVIELRGAGKRSAKPDSM